MTDIITLTNYQKSVLAAFREAGADTEMLRKFLKDVGWVGVAISDETINAALDELHRLSLIVDDPGE